MGWVGDARVAAGPEVGRYLEAVFTPGERLGVLEDDPTTFIEVAEVREVATIRVPSGRLIVDCPWPDDETGQPLELREGRELAARIPPGTYRVEAAWTEAPYTFMDEHFDGRECAAVRLCLGDEPVAGWEMALGVDDDIERLRAGEGVGFHPAELATGGFADATAWPELTTPFLRFWQELGALGEMNLSPEEYHEASGRVTRATEEYDHHFERVSDDTLRADLLTFPVDGSTVVWLGRTRSGEIASVVVPSTSRAPSPDVRDR